MTDSCRLKKMQETDGCKDWHNSLPVFSHDIHSLLLVQTNTVRSSTFSISLQCRLPAVIAEVVESTSPICVVMEAVTVVSFIYGVLPNYARKIKVIETYTSNVWPSTVFSELLVQCQSKFTHNIMVLHCVQKKTPTHIFFHISMNYLWI